MGIRVQELHKARPTLSMALLGLSACGVAMYTAYLGGKSVYQRGVAGLDPLNKRQASPPLFAREGPRQLLGDAVKGAQWLVERAAKWISRKERLSARSMGLERALSLFQAADFEHSIQPEGSL